MSFNIRYNLWQEKSRISPDSKFRADLWSKLDAKMHAEYGTKHNWFETRAFKFAAVTAALVLVAASTGTGAYAYSSSSVTEGTPLYPVKQQLENLEEKIQLTPEAKARFYLKKIERREAEVAQMNKTRVLKEKIIRVQDKIEQAEDNLIKVDKILQEKRSGDSRLREEIKQRLEKRIENRKNIIERRINSQEERKTSINNKLNQLNIESD
jgi:hypothetical protein